jgi:hypothetical protein
MNCSGDEIMRMSMIGRSDLPWPPKVRDLALDKLFKIAKLNLRG